MHLFTGTAASYDREALIGISTYAAAHGPWRLTNHRTRQVDEQTIREFTGDGVITHHRLSERLAGRLGVPAVALTPVPDDSRCPWVSADDAQIGQLAAEHLLDQGLGGFAYVGFGTWHRASDERYRAFVAALGRTEAQVPRWRAAGAAAQTDRWLETLTEALSAVAKPVGVLAVTDLQAEYVIEAAGRLELSVPDDVAVIGVGNDEPICEFTHPPLTSIDPNAERVGYEAAALLDRLIRGRPVPPAPPAHDRPVSVEPIGLVTRGSTDLLLLDDPLAGEAVRFIRAHAEQGVRIGDLVAQAGVSRKTLERRFQAARGHSLKQEIDRVRLQRTVNLLRRTNLPLYDIAARTGFRHASHLCTFVKRMTGRTTGQLRATHRRGSISG